ncbi:recombinase family protein [Streptomyces sp. NBC_00268]|uniref:recombinase family protein n=1 Tax=Streptomyces sp. NBC_00268 TaxID=2975695 RepID=UPI00225428B3|nr:recombinase family protein [Streptomyces sp. NBC_00268]MCX5192278.1 recombinase family protein [Streptomyces sp. NBC_00268]
MELVGYIRVSTDRQVEDGFGLAVQEKMIRTWCRQQGHALRGAVHRDEGYSGTLPAPERPALADALSEIEDGQAAGIVVGRLDRLARRLVTQEAVLAQVWKSNGRVFTTDQGEILQDDPEDPMRTAMRQMMGVFSELEHSMIVARLRAGRKEKAAQGGYAYGAPPYGWRAVGGELVEQPAEQVGLARARELRAAGTSLREICRRLEAEQIPPRRSDRWHPEAVRRMLQHEAPYTLRRQTPPGDDASLERQ